MAKCKCLLATITPEFSFTWPFGPTKVRPLEFLRSPDNLKIGFMSKNLQSVMDNSTWVSWRVGPMMRNVKDLFSLLRVTVSWAAYCPVCDKAIFVCNL